MPRRYSRRRRRRYRRYRTAARARRLAAYGLGRSRFWSSVKFPSATLNVPGNTNLSVPFRFMPFSKPAGSSTIHIANSMIQNDSRFKAMLQCYSQVRLINMYVSLTCLAPGVSNDYGAISLCARVIRNCTNATPASVFLDSNGFISVPGVVWKRTPGVDGLTKLSLTVFPKGTVENSQWFPTTLDESGNSLAFFTDGKVSIFAPAIDFSCFVTKTSSSQRLVPIQVFYRCTYEFRNADEAGNEESRHSTFTTQAAIQAENILAEHQRGGVTFNGTTADGFEME